MMLANIGSIMYYVDTVKYHCFSLSIDDILSTLREVGFTIWYAQIVKMEYEKGIAYTSDKECASCYVVQKT